MGQEDNYMFPLDDPRTDIDEWEAEQKAKRATMNGKPVEWHDAKKIINTKSKFKEKLLCDGLTFSSGTACAYSCSFCYVPVQMKTIAEPLLKGRKFEDVTIRRTDVINKVAKEIRQIRSLPNFKLDEVRVIYASPLVDVAANITLCKETVDICKIILANTPWHIRLLSKSNLLPFIAKDLALWDSGHFKVKERMIFGVSTGTLDDRIAQAFEEGTPLVSKRIESIRKLQDEGWRTFGMVCPSLPMGNTDMLAFAQECAEKLRYDKMEHVWAEVINVRGESFTRTEKCLREAGLTEHANLIRLTGQDVGKWEEYSRMTYEAHLNVCDPNKLRFLQYVNNFNLPYWKGRKGAVLL